MSVWANKHITNESMGKQTLDVKCLGANILQIRLWKNLVKNIPQDHSVQKWTKASYLEIILSAVEIILSAYG